MKEELQGKLIEVISAVQSAAGKAGEFAMEQLPDIAQSYIIYGRAITVAFSGMVLVIAVVMYAAALWAFRNPWNNNQYSWDKNNKRSESNQLVIFLGAAVGSLALMIAFISFDYLVWFAPKVWLLKELGKLVS